LNGGICKPGQGTNFECQCPPNFTGRLCGESIAPLEYTAKVTLVEQLRAGITLIFYNIY